jgi:hypothetical protein
MDLLAQNISNLNCESTPRDKSHSKFWVTAPFEVEAVRFMLCTSSEVRLPSSRPKVSVLCT